MRQCVISANCQSVPLAKQLLTFYPFACDYEVEIFTNFTRTIVPPSKLKSCDLLIYQKLDETWGELSERSLLANVNPQAKTICMPNVVNNALWPSMTHSGNLADSYWDSYIEELISRKLTIKEIMYIARRADYSKHYDIEKKFWESIEYERNKKYLGCDIICDFIIENYKKMQIFTTPNHPYGPLLNLIAKIVLEELGYSGIPDAIIPNLNCDDDFDLPIHPSVSKFLGLAYGDENQLYNVYGKQFTYYEYLYAYTFARTREVPVTYFLMECKKRKRID